MTPRTITLPNGLRLVVARVDAPIVALEFTCHAGPLVEPAELAGVSHALEHAIFLGTTRRSFRDLALALERLGVHSATTDDDTLTLSIATSPEQTGEAIALVGEVLGQPCFAGWSIERGVIGEEIAENAEDVEDAAIALAYAGTRATSPICGTSETIARIDEEALRRWHAQIITGANAALAIVGAVDPERVIASVSKAFAAMPRGIGVVVPPIVSRQTTPLVRVIDPLEPDDEPTPGSRAEIGLLLRSDDDDDGDALDVLAGVLAGDTTSRLFAALRVREALCYSFDCETRLLPSAGYLYASAHVSTQNAERAFTVIFDELASISRDGVTKEEISTFRDGVRFGLRMPPGPDELASSYADSALRGDEISTPEENAEGTLTVTPAQVQSVARKIVRGDRFTLVTAGELVEDKVRESVERRWAPPPAPKPAPPAPSPWPFVGLVAAGILSAPPAREAARRPIRTRRKTKR